MNAHRAQYVWPSSGLISVVVMTLYSNFALVSHQQRASRTPHQRRRIDLDEFVGHFLKDALHGQLILAINHRYRLFKFDIHLIILLLLFHQGVDATAPATHSRLCLYAAFCG